MRGQKVAIAVLTIIEAAFVLGAIGLMWFVGAVMGSAGGIGHEYYMSLIIWTVLLGILAALGIVHLVLGIKFLSKKPDKGIAITLLVFSVIMAANSIISLVKIVLLALYLQGNAQTRQTQQRFVPSNQPSVSSAYCVGCGWQNETGDMCCKICGRRLQ